MHLIDIYVGDIVAKENCKSVTFLVFIKVLMKTISLSVLLVLQTKQCLSSNKYISAVRIFEIRIESNRIVTSVFDLIRNEHDYLKFWTT